MFFALPFHPSYRASCVELREPWADLANPHSLFSTYAAMASAARNGLERFVLRANASSFALNAALILVVRTAVPGVLMPRS
jgi:hypothetical protein